MTETEFTVWLAANPGVIAAGVALLSLIAFGVARALETPAMLEPQLRDEVAPQRPEAAPRTAPAVDAPRPEAAAPEPVQESLPTLEAPAASPPEPVAALEPQRAPEPEPAPAPEPEAAPAPEPEPTPEPEPGRVSLRERLARTSGAFVGRLGSMLGGRRVDDELLEDLEGLLFTADLGVQTAESLLESVRTQAKGKDAGAVRDVLRSEISEKLQRVQPQGDPLATSGSPHVILVLGVNGSGKTTTIGKLAARYAKSGRTVLLGAGDTFRAAAIEQLQVWGERVGCDVIAGQAGGDPASVAFDTVKAAIARKVDVAIVDTAGRLQTKKPLMEELSKINRVLSRDLPDAPHEVLLVLDSNTGQNAISQAELFADVADLTGLVLTKLDGTAKGGVIVGLADRFGIPVKYVGVGEGIEDLRDFQADEFVDALFSDGEAG